MKLVNLLPKPKQRELQFEVAYHSLVVFIEVAFVSFVAVLLVLLVTKFYLAREIKVYDEQIVGLHVVVDKDENADLKKQIQKINGFIGDFNGLAAQTPAWSKVMRALSGHIPDGVVLQSLTADLGKAKIDIRGVASLREQIITLHDNIERDSEHFSNIDYPLENISQPTNVQFHFTFFIKEDLLKK